MAGASAYRALADLLMPPRCAACAAPCGPRATLCAGCRRRLAAGAGSALLAGVGPVSWAAGYEGVARELIAALKFGGRLALADDAAAAIVAALPAATAVTSVVGVPAAPLRRRRRGFDPAESIAAAVAAHLGLPLESVLCRRSGPRQVGRRRTERLSSPPRVRAVRSSSPRPLLVDDVLTTGATLRACADALRAGGAAEVRAAVFARALGGGPIWS